MGSKQKNTIFETGYTDRRGEWRPEKPISFAPLFVWPPKIRKFLLWLFNYLFTWNLIYLALVMVSYYFLQPPLEQMSSFEFSWISILFIRNMTLVWIVYGGWHLYLYTLKRRGNNGKYNPRWQSTDGSVFLWNNQVYDNVFWACASAVPIWTAFETLSFWLYANGKLPYLSFQDKPALFVLVFLLIPLWRELHFYFIHRLIHWKPLYKRIHYLHHYNINPGPWSGLAMHPIEHLLYFSVVLVHFIIPSHPIHFLYNSQHTALSPAPGHTGFEGKLGKFLSFGSYFHYLHHRLFECNYGEATIPLDKWFGIFEDGSQTQSEKQASLSNFHKFTVTKVVDESPEVKSFHFKAESHTKIPSFIPGQHFLFRFPFKEDALYFDKKENETGIKYLLRTYTISNSAKNNEYRISVKKENHGKVSSSLHSFIKPGDILEARGPKGSFTLRPNDSRTKVFIAGGIGITPILSMLKSIHNYKKQMHLFLAFKTHEQMVFKDEIKAAMRSNPGLSVHIFMSREQKDISAKRHAEDWTWHYTRLDISALKALLPIKKRYQIYYCGPDSMTQSLIPELKQLLGNKSTIHSEKFGIKTLMEKEEQTDKNIQVRFNKSDTVIEWDEDHRNLLEFAESNGISMEAGCMFGECGACSIPIMDGDVKYNYQTAIQPSRNKCLPCSCRPITDITIEA